MSHTKIASNSVLANVNQRVVFTSPPALYSTFLKKVILNRDT